MSETVTIPKPAPGQISMLICEDDGAKAWVSVDRFVLSCEPDFAKHAAPLLDDAIARLRETKAS